MQSIPEFQGKGINKNDIRKEILDHAEKYKETGVSLKYYRADFYVIRQAYGEAVHKITELRLKGEISENAMGVVIVELTLDTGNKQRRFRF